jgi:hypothetical protein
MHDHPDIHENDSTPVRRKGIGGHQSANAATHIWLTPPAIIKALGPFDLDPCGAPDPTILPTARMTYVLPQDGLALQWHGPVWLNPPYGAFAERWLEKLAHHADGIALIFARTETEAFHEQIWRKAEALLFLRGRLYFHYPDGRRAAANGGAPSVLIAYGADNADRLHDSLTEQTLDGHFVPLKRGAMLHYAAAVPQEMANDDAPSWREAVLAFLQGQKTATTLKDIYAAFENHPKTEANPNWKAKIRQTLARASVPSQGPAQYALALSA